MPRQFSRSASQRHAAIPYITAEMTEIMAAVEAETGDTALSRSLDFSPTALTSVRRLIAGGGSIIVDTPLIAGSIDMSVLEGTGTRVTCFLDDPRVIQLAELRRITRAEIAADLGLTIPGAKLMVIGSAPSALNRILLRRQHEPFSDVCVLAAPGGFASVVQLKERLRESDMAYIAARGKKGGTAATIAILNAILRTLTTNVKLK